jgi:hypothetical protein
MTICGIYKITNIINNRVYIGSTNNLKKPVMCIELLNNSRETFFPSLISAAKYYKINWDIISHNLRGKTKLSKNGTLRFEYV